MKQAVDAINHADISNKAIGAMDFWQQEIQCCGFNNASDYHLTDTRVPGSCCPGYDLKKMANSADFLDRFCPLEDAFKDGCKEKMDNRGLSVIMMAAFTFLGLLFVCPIVLAFTIIKEMEKMDKHYG